MASDIEAARSKVAEAVVTATAADLSAVGIDRIVLKATGLLDLARRFRREAIGAGRPARDQMRARLRGRYGVRRPGGFVAQCAGWAVALSIVPAGTALLRYTDVADLHVAQTIASVLIAVLLVVAVCAARVRPVTGFVTAAAGMAAAFVAVAGVLTSTTDVISGLERILLLASVGVAVAAWILLWLGRSLRPDGTREFEQGEREERQRMREDQARAFAPIQDRFAAALSDEQRELLEELRQHAFERAATVRGVDIAGGAPARVGDALILDARDPAGD